MSLLDQFEETYITKDWLESNGWTVAIDYSLVRFENLYLTDIRVGQKYRWGTHPRILPISYHCGTKTLTIASKPYKVETVEDMEFIINQILKREKLERL